MRKLGKPDFGELKGAELESAMANASIERSSSLLLSSLALSDTKKSMSLKYEPASEPLHIERSPTWGAERCRAGKRHGQRLHREVSTLDFPLLPKVN